MDEEAFEDIENILNEENFKDIGDYLPKELSLEILICVIHELTDQLVILKTIHKWPEVNIENFSYQSLEERFNDTISQDENYGEIVPKTCSFILSLFENLLDEMKNEGTCTKFLNNINILKRMHADEKDLLKEASKREYEVKELRSTLDNEKEDYINKILHCMEETGRIKDKTDNFQIESKIKLDYIKSWQNSKLEMKNTTFSEMYEKTLEKINTNSSKIDMENRVHADFTKAITEFTEELEEQIEEWKNKYSETLETMIRRHNVLLEKHNKQLEEISRMKELYEKRQREMQEWNEYKIEQEKIRLEKEKNNKAATKIQAWWRGTMVRKGYGKFRKKKEKKQKKSSEKSSSKK